MNVLEKKKDVLEVTIKKKAFNHMVVKTNKKEGKEGYLYLNEAPKVTVEIIIVNEENGKIVLVEEMINDKSKLVLPGATIKPTESSGETGVNILKNFLGIEINADDLELYDFRSNPDRDTRQWLLSVVYIVRIEDTNDNSEAAWFNISDVLTQSKRFGYDHHRILQNFKYYC